MFNLTIYFNLLSKREIVQYIAKMRFPTYYVLIRKCLSHTKYKQNPKQTVPNKVLRLKEDTVTPCDAYTRQLESHYVPVSDMYDSKTTTGNKFA